MPNANSGTGPEYEASDASVAHAGAARSLSGSGEPAPLEEADGSDGSPAARRRAETPTDEQLDARERRFTARRRKAMGPTPDQVPETVPEE
ncbi:hypothetical protein [Streptomyces sp. NPDC012888]|uniref:hypothetical protein n=1 Tax=Streptomyces sp. NPDC012888 TaxID=3364855 RepID=UPI0036B4ECAA